MKKLMIVLACFISIGALSQTKKVAFFVKGNCGMCEKRIEKAVDIKAVKFADWDEKTQMLKIVFNESKITLDEIHHILANIGHSTSKVKAPKEVYDKLHYCCKYDD